MQASTGATLAQGGAAESIRGPFQIPSGVETPWRITLRMARTVPHPRHLPVVCLLHLPYDRCTGSGYAHGQVSVDAVFRHRYRTSSFTGSRSLRAAPPVRSSWV